MNLNLGYDPTELPEPDNSFDPLPAGEYLCTIEKVECKQSQKNQNNWYLNIMFSVIGADYTNRKVFEIINFKNDNETAERIGAQQLGQLIRSLGVAWRGESDDLVGGNCYVKVTVKDDPQYGKKNDVKGHRAVENQAPKVSQAPAPAGSKKPPFFGAKK